MSAIPFTATSPLRTRSPFLRSALGPASVRVRLADQWHDAQADHRIRFLLGGYEAVRLRLLTDGWPMWYPRTYLGDARHHGRPEMTVAGTPPPPAITVILPDGHEIQGRLFKRRQTPYAWMYWISVAAWQATERGVAAADYRVWVTAAQLRPNDGVSYADVPSYPLPSPRAPDARWAWTVEQIQRGHRVVGTIVHSYECTDSPRGAEELNVDQALTALGRAGPRACLKCETAVALGPLV